MKTNLLFKVILGAGAVCNFVACSPSSPKNQDTDGSSVSTVASFTKTTGERLAEVARTPLEKVMACDTLAQEAGLLAIHLTELSKSLTPRQETLYVNAFERKYESCLEDFGYTREQADDIINSASSAGKGPAPEGIPFEDSNHDGQPDK